MSKILRNISEAVEDGDVEEVVELVKEALEDGEDPKVILNEGLLDGMNTVGDLFREGSMFVPEVLVSAKCTEAGLEILKPYLNEGDIKKAGTILFCTVKGDLHDIGKKLCIMLLQGAGYTVVDLGVDVDVDRIVAAVKEHNPDIMAMSAMLTTTMTEMDEAAEALKGFPVKIMVGGAPLSEDYAEGIGAYYSEDAIGAVELADKLMSI